MSEQSAKPYLIRALCEWSADNGLTPYLAVRVNAETRVPTAYVRNGEIVLNIGAAATRKLTIDNEWVRFSARFGGVSQEVAVPMGAVVGIFARETGYGFAFAAAEDPTVSLERATQPALTDIEAGLARDEKDGAKEADKPRPRPSHLSVIK